MDLMNIPHCNEGAAYITVNGQNRKIFELSKLSASIEAKVWEKQLLGSRMEQTRVTGMKGSGTASVYLMTDDYIKMFEQFRKTGVFPAVSIQAYHDDPQSSEIGRLEVMLSGVIFKKVPLVGLEENKAETDPVEIEFSFNDYQVLDSFKKPANI